MVKSNEMNLVLLEIHNKFLSSLIISFVLTLDEVKSWNNKYCILDQHQSNNVCVKPEHIRPLRSCQASQKRVFHRAHLLFDTSTWLFKNDIMFERQY